MPLSHDVCSIHNKRLAYPMCALGTNIDLESQYVLFVKVLSAKTYLMDYMNEVHGG